MKAYWGVFLSVAALCGGCRADDQIPATVYTVSSDDPYASELSGDVWHGVARVSVTDDGNEIKTCFKQTRPRKSRPRLEYGSTDSGLTIVGWIGAPPPNNYSDAPEECFQNTFQRQGQKFDELEYKIRKHFPCYPNACALDTDKPTVDALRERLEEVGAWSELKQ